MNVSLTPELEDLVAEKVRSGCYISASEVIREALRLLEEQDGLRAIRLEETRKKIAEGLEALDRGEGITGEEAFEKLRQKSEMRRRKDIVCMSQRARIAGQKLAKCQGRRRS